MALPFLVELLATATKQVETGLDIANQVSKTSLYNQPHTRKTRIMMTTYILVELSATATKQVETERRR